MSTSYLQNGLFPAPLTGTIGAFTAPPSTASTPSTPSTASIENTVITGGAQSGYDGANFSSKRGYIYFPTLNTQREVPTWTRLEMTRRARYLKRNVGFARRCSKGLAGMIGYLSPRAFTEDKTFNAASESAFERSCGTGQGPVFDMAGRHNIYAMQSALHEARLTDGDVGIVFTSEAGRAMVAVYESHQIGNGLMKPGELGWRDGACFVRNRAVAYRLLDPDNARNVDVPASEFCLHADYLTFGHPRGVTAFHHAINHMIDSTEIRSDVKTGIKLANRIGYYIERQLAAAGGGAPKGMGAGRSVITTENGGKAIIEDTFRSGKILGLDPGESIKQLLDERPHPNSQAFLEELNRDMAWGFGISSDLLWNIAKLGGATVRFALADAQSWIEAQQQILVDQFLHRWWVYFICKEIEAKRLAPPKDPDWMWKVGWQPQAKLTVDIGRDGKLSIDLHRAGMLTLQRWYGQQGLNHEHELRQHVREYALKIQLCQEAAAEFGFPIDPDKVFPAPPGSAPADATGTDESSIITPGDSRFSDPENIQAMLVEIRDNTAHLRAA